MQEVSAKQSNMNAYIHESISGIKVTQSFTREDVNLKVFEELMDDYQDKWMESRRYIALIFPIVKNISIMSQGTMLVVALVLLKGQITAGVVVASLAYIGNFWMPLINISEFYNQLVSASAYLERIFETIDIKAEITNTKDAYDLPEVKGQITFDHVTFGYEKDHVILNDFCLDVQAGETIAFVGPTGAGKTTVVNLISRFYDVNTGDIRDVTLHSLRGQLGIMMQDTFIFSGTIIDNIRYGRLDASDEEVIAAAKTVKAHDFIMDMAEDYHTEVNERGTRLSTGQRQLLSFARALLKDPKVLILDEATSSIDTQTEKAIQEGLDLLLTGRTSFVIAHRLSTIKKANRIIVINNKGIEEMGTHDELMENKGHYYELYQAQVKFLQEVG
jgi:ATP-binding cassette subfamily B multidrug efflux pump